MNDTMTRILEGISSRSDAYSLRQVLLPLVDRYSSQPITSAGLVINAGGALIAKIGAADFYALVQGILVKIAAGTAMPALTGINAPAGGFNVAAFFVDSAGVVTAAGGTPAATLGAVRMPPFPPGKALVGYLIITNAGAFTGGTTALDTATTVYVSPIGGGALDPSVLV
jgi:hypothetical protein